MSLHHFLLIYDLSARRLVDIRMFTSAEEATAAYGQAEREHLDDRDTEIVLVGSDSLETVKRTHAQYFTDSSSVELPELVGS
jgi:uroporphyrinogen-III synthase